MTDFNWNAVSAVGQWAGAIATFWAVVVSLNLARRQGKPSVMVKASISTIMGPPYIDFISFTVMNRGSRQVTITGYGWRARSPLRWDREFLHIVHDPRLANQQPLPKAIQPGESVMYVVDPAAFIAESERLDSSFYRRTWSGMQVPKRLYATVQTADGYSFQNPAAPSIGALQRHKDLSQLTGAYLARRTVEEERKRQQV